MVWKGGGEGDRLIQADMLTVNIYNLRLNCDYLQFTIRRINQNEQKMWNFKWKFTVNLVTAPPFAPLNAILWNIYMSHVTFPYLISCWSIAVKTVSICHFLLWQTQFQELHLSFNLFWSLSFRFGKIQQTNKKPARQLVNKTQFHEIQKGIQAKLRSK